MDKRAKPTPKPLHPLNHQHKEVEVGSRKGTSEAGVSPSGKFARLPCKDYMEGICTNHRVIIGILPNVISVNLNRDVNSVISAPLHTGRLRVNPAKNRKKDGDTVQWLCSKMHDGWVACFTTQSCRNLYRLYGRAQKSWDQFDEYDSQKYTKVRR